MSERSLRRLLALVERHLGIAYVDVVEWLRRQNGIDDIAARLEGGDPLGAVQEVESAAKRLAAEIHRGYTDAGQATATWLDNKAPTPLVRFDTTNDRAVRRARANELELIQGMTREQRDVIRQVVADGISRGANPRETARAIRDGIGLTAHQEQAVRNYRRALEDGDYSNALDRELRDKRADRRIRRARDKDEPLTAAEIDKLTEHYRRGMIAHRAEVIARTEGLRATHEGNEEALWQAIEREDVTATELVRVWHIGGGVVKRGKRKGRSRTRDSHRAMSGQRRAFGEPFLSGDGNLLRYPGDPNAPASDVISCRCAVATEYNPA